MSNELVTIEQISSNAMSVFSGESDALELIIAQIERDARSIVADVNTAKGRDVIRSTAANVAKAKVRIDDAGKTLVADLKELPKKVDASRKSVRDRLDALRDEVLQPLTAWEIDQERIKAEAEAKARAEAEQAEAERVYLLNWEEALIMNERFEIEKEKAEMKAAQEKAEAERIAKAKADQEEKDRLAREEAIRQQAIADEQAKQKAALEKAEADKKAAEQAAKDAIEKARIEKENAELIRLQAIEDERKRAAAELAKQKAIEEDAAKDIAHRSRVDSDIKIRLVENGINEEDAVKIISLAAQGKLGFLCINY